MVDDIRVVEPSDTSSLKREEGKDLVTLITCTPYGINTHRLLLTGHQVPMDPSDDSVFDGSGVQWQWWMWAILAAAVLIVLLMIYWWRKSLRTANAGSEGEGAEVGANGAGGGSGD